MSYFKYFCFIFLIATGIAAPAIVRGQSERNALEISYSIGNWSYIQLKEGNEGGKYAVNSKPIKYNSGVSSITLKYYFLERLAIGLAAVYENEGGNRVAPANVSAASTIETTVIGHYNRNVFSIAPELTLIYSRHPKNLVVAYGYIGAGISFLKQENFAVNTPGADLSETYTTKRIAAQVCPIGISVGHRLRGFAEGGYGYKGIIRTGISFLL